MQSVSAQGFSPDDSVQAARKQVRRIAKEGDMKNFNWNTVIGALMLVRFGQELGTESHIAKAIHDLLNAVLVVWR
jgi:K+-transporting ATPase c subunit